MKVNVRLFAVARELAGAPAIEVDVSPPATIAAVRAQLVARIPPLAAFGTLLRFAVNAEYADDATPISLDANVACIPPVSGG